MAVTNQAPTIINQTYGHLLRLKRGLLGTFEEKALTQHKIKNLITKLLPNEKTTLSRVLKSEFSFDTNLIDLNKRLELLSSATAPSFLEKCENFFSPSEYESALEKFSPPLPLIFEKVLPKEIVGIILSRLVQVDARPLNLFLERMLLLSPDQGFELFIRKINSNRIPFPAILSDLKNQGLSDITCNLARHLTHFDVTGLEFKDRFIPEIFSRASKCQSLVLTPFDLEPFSLKGNGVVELTLQDGKISLEGRGMGKAKTRGKAKTIFEFKKLEQLTLNGVCSDKTLNFIISSEEIKNLNIRILSLRNLKIDHGLDHLSNLQSLTHLQISKCPRIIKKLPLVLSHPNLKVLDLSNNSIENPTVIAALKLFKNCTALEVIQFPKIEVTRRKYEIACQVLTS